VTNDVVVMTSTLADNRAAVLKDANCALSLSLTASIKRNDTVTLTANPYTLSSAYSPLLNAIIKKLNQGFAVGDDLYQLLRTDPTHIELLIHNLPVSILTSEPAGLFPSLFKLIGYAIDLTIFKASFLTSNPAKRELKHIKSVVLAVDILHISHFGESIPLCSRACNIAPAYTASFFFLNLNY